MTITRLVCSGGGAKGVLYAGAYEALSETGLIQGITEVAGASAGAMCAALIAMGMPVDQFRTLLLETNLEDLMGNRMPGSITKDGAPLLDLLRQQISQAATAFLNPYTVFLTHSISDDYTSDSEREVIGTNMVLQNTALYQLKEKLLKNPPGELTFRDLNTLHEAFPDKFKKLTVTAVKHPSGELQIFNHALTPDVEIALACRASASIPVLLNPVKINMNGTEQTFVDGGLYDNVPDYFDADKKGHFNQNKKKKETLLLAFGEGIDNNKNAVFQALKNSDIIPDAFLEHLLEEARIKNHDVHSEDKSIINRKIDLVLTKYEENQTLTQKEAESIRTANKNIQWSIVEPVSIATFRDEIKKNLNPHKFYHASFLEQFKRNILVAWFSGFMAKYKNTDRKEEGYKKIHQEYRDNTIELRAGTVKTTDFDKAKDTGREMASIGYLDAMNYQFQYPLKDRDSTKFYSHLLDNFIRIHTALLLLSKKNPKEDKLLNKINDAIDKGKSTGEVIFELIKPLAEKKPRSSLGFSLSRAVEWKTQKLTDQELILEVRAKSRNQQWGSQMHFCYEKAAALTRKFKSVSTGLREEDLVNQSELIAQALVKPFNFN